MRTCDLFLSIATADDTGKNIFNIILILMLHVSITEMSLSHIEITVYILSQAMKLE